MDKKFIRIIPFMRENRKWRMWSGKIMATVVMYENNTLIPGDKKILQDEEDETKVKQVY